MKLSQWVKEKTDANSTKIRSLKSDLKSYKGQDHETVSKRNKLSQQIHKLELQNSKLKKLEKAKLVRLSRDSVVNISLLDVMLKKLKGAHTKLVVRDSEIVLEYSFNNQQHGKLTINGNGLGVETLHGVDETKIPDEVEIPLFDKSEVNVDDISDERF